MNGKLNAVTMNGEGMKMRKRHRLSVRWTMTLMLGLMFGITVQNGSGEEPLVGPTTQEGQSPASSEIDVGSDPEAAVADELDAIHPATLPSFSLSIGNSGDAAEWATLYQYKGQAKPDGIEWLPGAATTEVVPKQVDEKILQLVRVVKGTAGGHDRTVVAEARLEKDTVQFRWNAANAARIDSKATSYIETSRMELRQGKTAVGFVQFIQPESGVLAATKAPNYSLPDTIKGTGWMLVPHLADPAWLLDRISQTQFAIRNKADNSIRVEFTLNRGQKQIATNWRAVVTAVESDRRTTEAALASYGPEAIKLGEKLKQAEDRLAKLDREDYLNRRRLETTRNELKNRLVQIPKDVSLARARIEQNVARLETMKSFPEIDVQIVVGSSGSVAHRLKVISP